MFLNFRIIALIIFGVFLGPLAAFSQQSISPQDWEKYKNLSPDQQRAVQDHLGRGDGMLNPQALEMLRTNPDFKGLQLEDIKKGRELLDARERAEKKLQAEEDFLQKSRFRKSREVKTYQDVSLDLKPFGYDFFKEAVSKVLTDRKDLPVPLNYVIGPGDEIRILLWGRVNAQYNLIVDRDGKITVPQIGPISVAGLTFDKMSSTLIKKAEQIVGTNIDISMGNMKTIPVFILGDVKQPGAYNVDSSSTITDALLIAGGPTEIGSMRKIQLRRKNKIITTFDLYDLLLKGDKSKDAFLQAGDVVFVPVVGPVAAVTGNVRRPAIYELKNDQTLQQLFELAGGIIPQAYTQQIQIERVIRNEKQVVVDIDDKHLEKSKNILLQDSDLVKIFSIVDMDMNVVFMNGNLKRPGKYEFKPGMRIKDLIRDLDELLPDTNMGYALVKRESPPGMEPKLVPFSPTKLYSDQDSAENIELRPKDKIYFFKKWFFKDKPFITVEGEIRGPFDLSRKFYKIVDKLTKIRRPDLIEQLQAFESNFQQINADKDQDKDKDKDKYKYKYSEADADRRPSFERSQLPAKDVSDTKEAKEKPESAFVKQTRDLTEEIQNELIKENHLDLAEEVKNYEAELKRTHETSIRYFKEIRDELIKIQRFDLVEKIRTMENEFVKNGQISVRDFRDIQQEFRKIDRMDLVERSKIFESKVKRNFNIDLVANMRVKDAILSAGGLTRNALMEKGEIIRVNDRKTYTTIYFSVAKAMADDPAENFLLADQDRIVIHSVWEQIPKQTVSIDGEISKPGTYQFTEHMTVKDLVFKGGNILESAYLNEAEISSMVVTPGNQIKFEHKIIDLRKALDGNPGHNMVLKPNDRVLIKRIPEWRDVRFVTLSGEVKFPGRYPIRKGERLSSAIERAGGYTNKAYLRGAFFTRERVRELQQKGLEDMADRLERELLSEGSAAAAKASSAEDLAATKAQLDQKVKFVASLRKLKATGRMTIKLAHIRILKGSEFDVVLEDGDTLEIPEANNVVNVIGSVMSNGSFIYSSRMHYEDYIEMTGGYSSYADKNNIFVMKVDGSARKLSKGWFNWSSKRSRWEMSGYEQEISQIEPGDVIVVPEKIDHIAWLREIKDITQIMMNMAVVAGVVLKMY